MSNELINVTQDELDLCSEGELSPDERQDLFCRLDEHPHQWRFCALSALETVAVRNSVTSVVASENSQSTATIQAPAVRSVHRISTWIAALCCVMALGAGAAIGNKLAGDAVATAHVEEIPHARGTDLKLADDLSRDKVLSILDRLNIENEKLLAVVRVDGERGDELVPVVSCPRLATEVLRTAAKPIPPHQIKLAKRNGYHVSRQAQMLAIERPSQRTQIVPLQTVRYQYVGSLPL